MIGLTVTKDTINATAGDICRSTLYLMRRIEHMRQFLVWIPDSELIALGFTQAEVDLMKSTFSDVDGLEHLRQVFEGLAAHAQADMRTNPRQLAGLGDV